MSHEINRSTGAVSLPEAGEGAFLQFTVSAFEQLCSAYGEDYIEKIIKGLAKMDVGYYQKVIACTLQNSTNGDIPYGLLWQDLNIRILDALNLAIYGKTYDEQKEENEKEMMKRLEGMESNPQLAAILSLMSPGKPESEPG